MTTWSPSTWSQITGHVTKKILENFWNIKTMNFSNFCWLIDIVICYAFYSLIQKRCDAFGFLVFWFKNAKNLLNIVNEIIFSKVIRKFLQFFSKIGDNLKNWISGSCIWGGGFCHFLGGFVPNHPLSLVRWRVFLIPLTSPCHHTVPNYTAVHFWFTAPNG